MISSVSSPPVVFAGAAVLDAIALIPGFPRPDGRVVADDIVCAGGGPAATAAVAAARLGVSAGFIGTVGDDEDGRRLLDELRAEGVDTGGTTVVGGTRSGASVVMVDRSRGTRAICARPGPPIVLNDVARGWLAAAMWVHVDQVGWAPVHRAWRALPGHRRPRLSVDAGNVVDGLDLADVELFVPTLEALTRRYGDSRCPDQLLDAALAEGARQVVVTLGADGSMAATAQGLRCSAAGLRGHAVVSTLGAGDVFHGALLAAVARGMPLPGCLRYATTAAGLSCRGLDGRSAIPTHRDVLRATAAADRAS